MPCTLCKNRDHVLTECTHHSIANTIDDLRLRCMDSIRSSSVDVETNRASLNAVKEYVTQLSCPMLKSIIYKTMFFKPMPARDYHFDPNYNFHKGCNYYSGTGAKMVLVGKVMHLFLSNIRREYPILFLKQSPRFRRVYFEHEIYWDNIACESSIDVSKNYAIQHVKLFDTFYTKWIIHLKRDLEKLIKQSMDHFSGNAAGTDEVVVTGSTYNLHTMRDNERILHASYLEGNNSVYLRGINYNEREAYYLKKKLMEHMVSLYGNAMECSYNANEDIQLRVHRIVADEPGQQLLLPQSRPQSQPRMPAVEAAPDVAALQALFLLLQEINIASRSPRMHGRSGVSIQQNMDYLQQVLVEYENRANVLPPQEQSQTNRRSPRLRKLKINIVLDNVEVCSGFDCAVCMDNKTTKDGHLVFSCNHEFCGTCTNQYLDDYRAKTTAPICPLCRGKIDSIVVKNPDMLENKGILNNLQNICF